MVESVYGKPMVQWIAEYPLIAALIERQPLSWFNPAIVPVAQAMEDIVLGPADVADASARLKRFAPYLAAAFPEVSASQGIIESPLLAVSAFASHLRQRYGLDETPRLLLKQDSHLPIAGSVKARGGIYEVLCHAERLALEHGLLNPEDDYRRLDEADCRALFSRYRVAVGSTGNLGLSIGIAAARLGFATSVHMSADARQWKKDRLRSHGVEVVEYLGDYGEAVEQGRKQAAQDPLCHFVDDENSTTLFLGYAVAGERLKAQFQAQGIEVGPEHPLFAYLPCGVGGAPGGIAFGLKLAFGDHVHCLFAEPTNSPCMLMGVYTGLHDRLAVQDFGISNLTVADGLAVGRPSGFVGKSMQRMIDGYYSLGDEELFELLYAMHQHEHLALEPSALAGAPGVVRVLEEQQGYKQRLDLSPAAWANAHHLMWATGGGMLPKDEFQGYWDRGYLASQSESSTHQTESSTRQKESSRTPRQPQ